MSLEYNLYHSSCYSAYAVIISCCCNYTHIAISSELFRNISVCYRAVKDRQATVAIFKVFWSLLSVRTLKLTSKVATWSTPLHIVDMYTSLPHKMHCFSLWPWSLTSDLGNLSSNALSHVKCLRQVSLKSLLCRKRVTGANGQRPDGRLDYSNTQCLSPPIASGGGMKLIHNSCRIVLLTD